MKVKTIGAIAGSLILAGLAFGPVRRHMDRKTPALETGYRGLILELPKAQLAWVKKGDSVDVICVFEARFGGSRAGKAGNVSDVIKEKVAMTILQNVKVAGVDAHRGTIVLLVNSIEAQYAALSRDQGIISLELRAKGDSELKPLAVSTYRKLIN
jgi:hypothetical protein